MAMSRRPPLPERSSPRPQPHPLTSPARAGQRVLVVARHRLFAESLASALTASGSEAAFLPIPERSGSTRFLHRIVESAPDVVLLALESGSRDGRLLGLVAPRATVVVISDDTDDDHRGEWLALGARAVLPASLSVEELLGALTRARGGTPWMDPREHARLADTWQQTRQRAEAAWARLDLLTAREVEVLEQLRRGRTVREIAALAVVSESTVRGHVKSILHKLEVRSQISAIALANEAGWRPGR